MILSASANAASVTYSIGVKANDEFVWEIKDLNLDKFEATFGIEPNFHVGSQVRMVVREVDDLTSKWSIVVEFWDYGSNWLASGSVENLDIPKYPNQYDDFIFIPTPVNNYIEEALTNLSSQYYSISDNMIGKQDVSEIGVDFKVEKTYNINGILIDETYLDQANLVIVKLEATFQIVPFGFSFLAYMSLTVIGLIIIVKRKKLNSKIKT
jgi:hypothetical protein